MKKQYLLYALALFFVVGSMSSCKEDIDLDNLDTQAEVELGLAIPMGSMTANIGNFIGNGKVDGIYVGDDRLLYFRDTFDISRKFHDVDLKSKITDFGPKHFNVHDKLNEMGYLDASGKVKTDKLGIPITLDFPFWLKLKNINSNIYDERLDSAMIINSYFTSKIGRTNLPLLESWVDKVEIELGPEFHRPEGKMVEVCGAGQFAYDSRIPISIDQFVLDLMTKHDETDWKKYPYNVKDSCQLHIRFTFTIPATETSLVIPSNATYDYNLNVQFVKYEAIWGFFRPSADMRDESTIIIEDEWAQWRHFKKATLPFHDPKVNVMIGHTITGVMNIHGEYLYAKNTETNDSIFAYFDPGRTQIKRQESFWRPGQFLPLDAPIGDSIHNEVLFDKDTYRGQIDKMFYNRPDVLGYKFYIDFDSVTTPQIRILPDTRIKVAADIWAPFAFNEGVEANYVDTTKNVNISKYSLDSLVSSVDVIDTIKTSNVKLVLHAENRIPLSIRGVVYFYDADMNVVMDPEDPSKPLRISQIDTLLFNAPQYSFNAGISTISEPGVTIYTMDLHKKHFDAFTKIKSIRYFVELDGKDLHDEYKTDPNFLIRLTSDDQLKLNIGLATDIDAVLNFNKKDKKK